MNRPAATGERWVGLFLLAALLFSPPFLSIADQHQLLGIPFLYIYLFTSWGLVIFLLARTVAGNRRAAAPRRPAAREAGGTERED